MDNRPERGKITVIESQGFEVINRVVDSDAVEELRQLLGSIENEGVLRRDATFAIRNLLDVSAIADLARSKIIRELVEPHLGDRCFAVRGIFFDKTPGANWKVPWHQDLSIAVREKCDVSGYSPWSEKAGVVHVQPPIEILEQMLTVRLHLDDCDQTNGALRFVPGSHHLGRLAPHQIEDERQKRGEIMAEVEQGGVLLMKPLVLHASSPSETPSHRRVVHLEFASKPLQQGLEWRWQI